MQNLNMSRVNIVGTSGSGKSSVGRKLAEILGQPYIQLDQVYWEANWAEPTDEKFFPKIEAALKGEKWVLDGNYDRTNHIKWKNVTLIIWLDYSFPRTFWQVVKRSVVRAAKRQELWPNTGNRESFYMTFFTRRSIILWMMTSYKKVRARYSARLTDPALSHIQFIRLRNPSETKEFFKNLNPNSGP